MRHCRTNYSVATKGQQPGYSFATKAYSECQLIYVTEGQLLFSSRKQEPPVVLGPHAFVLLRTGAAFRLSCETEAYGGFCVFAQGETAGALQGPALSGPADGTVRLLAGMIQRHISAPVEESRESLSGLGRALMWDVLALTRERQGVATQDWAEAARTVLDMNLGSGLPVREALATLPVCYRQLCRCFRERYGTSPKAYQDLARVNEARRLLRETSLDITTIAVELGFSSSQHFAARFRQLVGSAPSDYRKGSSASLLKSL